MKSIIHGKLVAVQDDFYTVYVFENLEEPKNSLLHYVAATKPPNWKGKAPEYDAPGFIEVEYVNAGDKYIQRNTGETQTYKYTQCYFVNFVKEVEKQEKTNVYKFE